MGIMRTALLLAGMTALVLVAGFLLGGKTGLLISLLLAGGMNLYAWYNSDTMALRAHNAYPADPRRHSDYIALVKELAERANLPEPAIYILPSQQPNAFATGRSPEKSAVAATEGLIALMTREELAGVMAHELAHIKNRDTLTMTVTATLAGAISMLGNFGFFFGFGREREGGNPMLALLMMIVAPIAAMIIQMAVSRSREYEADHIGGDICGNPLWLASALTKLNQSAERLHAPSAEQHPETAHLFIVNPLFGGMKSLFSTHPAVEKRVALLKEQARAYQGRGASIMPLFSQGNKKTVSPSAKSSSDQHDDEGPWGKRALGDDRSHSQAKTNRSRSHLPRRHS